MNLPEPVPDPPARRSPRGARMQARACVKTTLSNLRSEAPLILRPTIANKHEPWVHGDRDAVPVALTAGAAGPIGGDQQHLTVHVGLGSTLVLTEISHTLLLPGHDRATSTATTDTTVESGGTLIWLPEPIIVARHCDHINTINIGLGKGARLMVREELLLGRHQEDSGQLRQRTYVTADQQPLFHQDLQLGDTTSRTPPSSPSIEPWGPSWSSTLPGRPRPAPPPAS